MLGWTNGPDLKYDTRLNIYAPSGDYEKGALANVGKNLWTFEPMVSLSYLSTKIGLEGTAFAGLDFNTENPATDYQSGTQFHLDGTIAQDLPLLGGVVGVGANGFYYLLPANQRRQRLRRALRRFRRPHCGSRTCAVLHPKARQKHPRRRIEMAAGTGHRTAAQWGLRLVQTRVSVLSARASGPVAGTEFQRFGAWGATLHTHHCERVAGRSIWTALAERSADSALAWRSPIQSGVALRLPPHSILPRMARVPNYAREHASTQIPVDPDRGLPKLPVRYPFNQKTGKAFYG